ncbi:outer membrane lipoprotein Omp10 [Shinella zoogloeoides]|uniref:outer membrane lipoprotein Omp10 n=1 Tax=Shinella zoogloeoides TaxID=352475 RepID=UPI0028B226B2|nr:outer membrane lipoprotein Omp10 [Shinella zoogloeoides]
MKPIAALSLLAAAVALASCQTEPAPRSLPVAQQPMQQGVEGAWVDPNGIVSTFSSGTFTTRTTDTNQLLASGTYIKTSPTLVEINMTSLVRNTQSKVNCALVNQHQLNCTTAEGAQFSLARRT